VSGSIAAPRVDATVTIEEADLAVPELPAAAARPVAAQIIDSASGKTLSAATVQQGPALMAATLNITVTLPGQTFVRGRGLDSEWRGRLVVSGTPAAPSITGRLDVVRGTYDLVGKTFVLSQGTITFLGGRTIDPIINIQATAQSSDITAMVALTGTATQPTIKLTSSPALPNDEILARLLFGTSMSQIGPAQGVEIASAAASLAGGDALDVLGKLRRGLGLDRLGLGSAPGSVVPGIGVPALSSASGPATGFGATPLAPGTSSGALAGGTALNAGKYVANGVYVGVSQGLQPGSSTANVTIDVTRHISVDTEAGQMSGAGIGIGVNWKLDY
jgi:translocation and assembly module TamB